MTDQVAVLFVAFAITVLVGVMISFAQKHWKIQNDATRNKALADYASRLAPFVVHELKVFGADISQLTIDHPLIRKYGLQIIAAYPEFSKGVGLTNTAAFNFVLSETLRLIQISGVLNVTKP